jgi:SAM-dependent methyltransferase
MPTTVANKLEWDGRYRWDQRGDEWSRPWGGAAAQWYTTLLPRIRGFLPAGTVLEIACGHGRWTGFLKDACRRLVLVDLSESCIAACRERFAGESHIEYHVNDGRSLAMLPDRSVDFVFSFDSLVHADASVMTAYLAELARILTPDGAAFLHHSNLGEYAARYARVRRVPKLEGLLILLGALDPFTHWRDPGVSAGAVAAWAEEHDLRCIRQELVHWSTRRALIDCLSTVVRRGSALDGPPRVVRNRDFMREAAGARRLSQLYGADGS